LEHNPSNAVEPYVRVVEDRYRVTFDELLNVKIEPLTERCKRRFDRKGPPGYVLDYVANKRRYLGYVYVIHFDIPYKHAKHYMGFTKNVPLRMLRHQAGRGATLMRVIEEAGIDWQLAKVMVGDRREERRLKKHSSTRYCPICKELP
jgi:predicted GIY-YIG superfamily endonuclease